MPADPYLRIAAIYTRVVDPINLGLHHVARSVYPPRRGMRVLDVGCGTGAQLDAYVAAGVVATGVDLSPAMLARARARLGDTADLRLADARLLPFDDGAFDLVLVSLVLHELAPDKRHSVLEEVARVLSTEGRLVLTEFTPNPRGLRGHIHRGVSWVVERLAGREHFRQFRRFVRTGGLPAALPAAGLAIEATQPTPDENIAVYLAGRSIR